MVQSLPNGQCLSCVLNDKIHFPERCILVFETRNENVLQVPGRCNQAHALNNIYNTLCACSDMCFANSYHKYLCLAFCVLTKKFTYVATRQKYASERWYIIAPGGRKAKCLHASHLSPFRELERILGGCISYTPYR